MAEASNEKTEKKSQSGGTFVCSVCHLSEHYHYKGRNPPFVREISFLEDCYVSKDSFAPQGEGLFLLLGSECTVCGRTVCQANTCSVFYSKRFCLPCAVRTITAFPPEMQQKIAKAKQAS